LGHAFSSADSMLILDETAKQTHPATHAATRINASLNLNFEYDAARGTAVLQASSQEPPLRVVRAFIVEDGSALVHVHNVSGGLLGGDQLTMSLEIGESAHVQVTTTGATRIYRSRADADPATQRIDVRVAQNAFLEYLPDPLIPFAGSRFAQRTTIHLDAGAGLFWWEVLAPGREARGELFAYDAVEMKTDIFALGSPIAIERVRIEPGLCPIASPVRLGKYRYWATFYICRVGLAPGEWLALEQHLRDVARELSPAADELWGISTLPAYGIVCRCLAVCGRDALAGLHKLWRAAKLVLYGTEPIPPRKVN
jgi:urease accessory protein